MPSRASKSLSKSLQGGLQVLREMANLTDVFRKAPRGLKVCPKAPTSPPRASLAYSEIKKIRQRICEQMNRIDTIQCSGKGSTRAPEHVSKSLPGLPRRFRDGSENSENAPKMPSRAPKTPARWLEELSKQSQESFLSFPLKPHSSIKRKNLRIPCGLCGGEQELSMRSSSERQKSFQEVPRDLKRPPSAARRLSIRLLEPARSRQESSPSVTMLHWSLLLLVLVFVLVLVVRFFKVQL